MVYIPQGISWNLCGSLRRDKIISLTYKMKIPFYLVRWEKFLTAIQYYISIYDFIEKILPINVFI